MLTLGTARLETMALLTVGMIGARTVNLVHVANERGEISVDPASTYSRLQRFFRTGCACPTTGLRRCSRAWQVGGKADSGAGPEQLEDRRNACQLAGGGGPDAT